VFRKRFGGLTLILQSENRLLDGALWPTPNTEMTLDDSVIFYIVVSTVILSLWGCQ
jgi:hypothetical protein